MGGGGVVEMYRHSASSQLEELKSPKIVGGAVCCRFSPEVLVQQYHEHFLCFLTLVKMSFCERNQCSLYCKVSMAKLFFQML